MPRAYYNEFDPYAAQWLRNLIAAGHIAPGDVDQRSIEDVTPLDLAGYTQCHFFAGVGVWSLALRRAGWADSRPVWTGSCPCQPFSAAGKGNGFADERHLWPAWLHLIGQRSPVVLFGEQVSSKDADIWVDLVQTDMEALGYAFGAVPFPSAGIGAPHIRDRLYWLADSASNRRFRGGSSAEIQTGRAARPEQPGELAVGFKGRTISNAGVPAGVESRVVGNSHDPRLEGLRGGHKAESGRVGTVRSATKASESCRVEHATGDGWEQRWTESGRGSIAAGCTLSGLDDSEGKRRGLCDTENLGPPNAQSNIPSNSIHSQFDESCGQRIARTPTGPVNGHWRNADWLLCRDGKWRAVEPGTFPLVNGAPARVGRLRAGVLRTSQRVGRLRAYGNAICAEPAIAFIKAYMECQP